MGADNVGLNYLKGETGELAFSNNVLPRLRFLKNGFPVFSALWEPGTNYVKIYLMNQNRVCFLTLDAF